MKIDVDTIAVETYAGYVSAWKFLTRIRGNFMVQWVQAGCEHPVPIPIVGQCVLTLLLLIHWLNCW